jgi:teichoic acid transport system permease protein
VRHVGRQHLNFDDGHLMTSLLDSAEFPEDDQELQQLGVRPALRDYLSVLWARRDFIVALPISQLRSRNANTLLGSLWHLMNPLILLATYYLIFGIFFNARDDVENYIGFLVVGLFVFLYSQKCLTGGASTIVANEGIIRNVNLPRAAFPIGSVVAETLAHVPAMGLLLALLLITGESPGAAWILLIPLVALQLIFNLGLSFWVSRLTFHFRDVQNLLPFVSRLLLYVSGIFFTASRVPEGFMRQLFELNPLYVFITLHREILLGGAPSPSTWLTAAAWTLGSLGTGLIFFWFSESSYGRD